jgi:hypothetical protein
VAKISVREMRQKVKFASRYVAREHKLNQNKLKILVFGQKMEVGVNFILPMETGYEMGNVSKMGTKTGQNT